METAGASNKPQDRGGGSEAAAHGSHGSGGCEQDLLIGPGIIATPDKVLEDGGILVRDGRIAAVDDYAALREKVQRDCDRLDARGGVVLPGLINAHTHFYAALACGFSPEGPAPAEFREILERFWWRLDRALSPEDVRTSALLTASECVRCGVTTVADHHSSPNACNGSLDLIHSAVQEIGIRAALCYEVSDRDGAAQAKAGIAENARFSRALARSPSPRVRSYFGLHALFTVSDETLLAVVSAAREESRGLHLHVAEDRCDVDHNLRQHGCRTVERLARHGALASNTLAAHCVHVDEREMEQLAASGALVIHNPESNQNNGVGCAPVAAMLAKQVRVGLGTDGFGADILGAARAAFLMQRHTIGPAATWEQTTAPLLRNNAAWASALFGEPLGIITPGAAADLVVLDYDPRTPLEAENLGAHAVHGFAARHVAATIVGGRVLMKDRRLLTAGVEELHARARMQARSLWRRM